MATLLLRLAAPLQAWGVSSKFNIRTTGSEPSKSGVIGMIAAALGRERSDSLEDLAELKFGVRKDQNGTLIKDFQTAHGTGRNVDFVTTRYYLADAVFLAGLEGDRAMLEEIDRAIRNPVFPLFLGRRSCPPTLPLSLGVVDFDLDDALRRHEWMASEWYKRKCGTEVSLEIISDAGVNEGHVMVRDHPLSFDQTYRKHALRSVRHDLNGVKVGNKQGSRGRFETTHDAMSEIRRDA